MLDRRQFGYRLGMIGNDITHKAIITYTFRGLPPPFIIVAANFGIDNAY